MDDLTLEWARQKLDELAIKYFGEDTLEPLSAKYRRRLKREREKGPR